MVWFLRCAGATTECWDCSSQMMPTRGDWVSLLEFSCKSWLLRLMKKDCLKLLEDCLGLLINAEAALDALSIDPLSAPSWSVEVRGMELMTVVSHLLQFRRRAELVKWLSLCICCVISKRRRETAVKTNFATFSVQEEEEAFLFVKAARHSRGICEIRTCFTFCWLYNDF